MMTDDELGTLPGGIYDLIDQIDTFVAARPHNQRMPVVLLKRGTSGDRTENRLVSYYRARLVDSESDPERILAPHAFVEDGDVAGAAESHVEFVRIVAGGLQDSMPKKMGKLRLPLLRTCEAALSVVVTATDHSTRRRQLREALYRECCERHPWLDGAANLAQEGGKGLVAGFLQAVLRMVLVAAPSRLYGRWLANGDLRHIRKIIKPQSGDFLSAALDITRTGSKRGNAALVQRVLLAALLLDLSNAVSDRRFWRLRRPWRVLDWMYRARRRGSFVLLLGGVGGERSQSRQLLDNYDAVVRDGIPSPLLILGALDGEPPADAQLVRSEPGAAGRAALARRVREVYRGRWTGGNSCLYVVYLPAEDDDGTARRSLEADPLVPARADRGLDVVRALAAPLALVALVGGGVGYALWPGSATSCQKVANREIVGVTDGAECTLAWPGDKGKALRGLEAQVRRQNAAVDTSLPYRSIVFYAPLSVADNSGDVPLNGLESLAGTIKAQAAQNARPVGSHMQVRLLIANPGDKFAYGHRGGAGPDVTQEIADRPSSDRIAAVVGITQSRQDSLTAIGELDAQQIPIIASSVTGTRMVDSPNVAARYFQVSPPSIRLAPVLAEFARHSPDIAALSRPLPGSPDAPGAPGRREAVVVFHPDDEVFSKDLEARLAANLSDQVVHPVPFPEQTGGQDVANIAQTLCQEVAASGGYVIYAGRSGRMPDLLDAMKQQDGCIKKDGRRLAIFAESVPSKYLEAPADFATDYPHFALYFAAGDAGAPGKPDEAGLINSDAAEAYDALNMASRAIDGAYAQNSPNQKFPANAVYSFIWDKGVTDYHGVTGVLTLNSTNRYPPDKAVYILQIAKPDPLLACGLLPDRTPPTWWGPPGTRFHCP